MNKFATIHKYRRYVRRGLVPPLECTCGQDFAILLDEDEPVLACFNCTARIRPGHNWFLSLEEKVREVERGNVQ